MQDLYSTYPTQGLQCGIAVVDHADCVASIPSDELYHTDQYPLSAKNDLDIADHEVGIW